MEFVRNDEDRVIGIILNPGERCNCELVKKEISDNYRTWCDNCMLINSNCI